MHMVQHLLIADIAPICLTLALTKHILRPVTRRIHKLERAAGPFGHPAFGVIAYRFLTGRFPRRTISEAINLATFPRPIELNPSVPAALETNQPGLERIAKARGVMPETERQHGPQR